MVHAFTSGLIIIATIKTNITPVKIFEIENHSFFMGSDAFYKINDQQQTHQENGRCHEFDQYG